MEEQQQVLRIQGGELSTGSCPVQLVARQKNSLDMMRPQLFRFNREHNVQKDMATRMSLPSHRKGRISSR